jgi:SAM-dependent methyltransferase
MFFTARSLEQATDEGLAEYQATRFSRGKPVADLCCGVGGDLLALARRGSATGVDRDPILALLAEANCRAVLDSRDGEVNGHSSRVLAQDVASIDLGAFSAWHIDPDRRPGGRRTTRVELHEPGPEFIERCRATVANGAVKLAPAATLPEDWPREAELEWLSRDGECRQLVCWFGSLAEHTARRRATLVDAAGRKIRSIIGVEQDPPLARGLATYLYEPDAAVLAAGLTGALAAEHSLTALAPGIAYLTSDALVTDPALACFRIEEVLPLDMRRLRAMLRERNIGRLEIKKRGVDVTPEQLRRDLKLKGEHSATLLIAPIAGRPTVMLAQRIVAPIP